MHVCVELILFLLRILKYVDPPVNASVRLHVGSHHHRRSKGYKSRPLTALMAAARQKDGLPLIDVLLSSVRACPLIIIKKMKKLYICTHMYTYAYKQYIESLLIVIYIYMFVNTHCCYSTYVQGADPNLDLGWLRATTPLHEAATPEIAHLLLSFGARSMPSNNPREPAPIWYHEKMGRPEVAQFIRSWRSQHDMLPPPSSGLNSMMHQQGVGNGVAPRVVFPGLALKEVKSQTLKNHICIHISIFLCAFFFAYMCMCLLHALTHTHMHAIT
jgi:hypothetical protein